MVRYKITGYFKFIKLRLTFQLFIFLMKIFSPKVK